MKRTRKRKDGQLFYLKKKKKELVKDIEGSYPEK